MSSKIGMLTLVAAALLGIGASSAQAATLASAPLLISDNQTYTCNVVNVGTKPVPVEVDVTIEGGGYGAAADCTLAPTEACAAPNSAGFAQYRYCTVKVANRKYVRATFCNTSTGVCIPVE